MFRWVIIGFLLKLAPGLCEIVETQFQNPIFETADPFVYLHTDGYYYNAIPNGDGIEMKKSKTLTDWTLAEQRVIFTANPPYDSVWGPQVHYILDNWFVYFSLGTNRDYATHRMYVIQAVHPKKPLGEYTQILRLKPEGPDTYNVDGTVLQYGNGRLYFIWAGWHMEKPIPGPRVNLYISRMRDPKTLIGPRKLLRQPKEPWESKTAMVNTSPRILQNNGSTFVIFAGSANWTPDCCLGIIGIDGNKDPLVRANWWQNVDRCIFWDNEAENVYAVCSASFTKSIDGEENWVVYAALEDRNAGLGGRTTRAEKFDWYPDGTPDFPRPAGFCTSLSLPSGEDGRNTHFDYSEEDGKDETSDDANLRDEEIKKILEDY